VFKKLTMIVAALAATLAFGPPAHAAGPVDAILVGGIEQDADIAGTAKGALNVVVTTSSGPMNLSCTGADLTGEVLGANPSNPYIVIDDLAFGDCDGPGGSLMNVAVVCPLKVDYNTGAVVDWSLTDQVPGVAHMTDQSTGQHCIQAKDKITNGFLCSFSIGGTIPATFDEDPKTVSGVSYQDLTISGPGLQVKNASCLGQVSNNDPIALTASFNIDVDGGPESPAPADLINFVPAP
jgi:hypothetical protein